MAPRHPALAALAVGSHVLGVLAAWLLAARWPSRFSQGLEDPARDPIRIEDQDQGHWLVNV